MINENTWGLLGPEFLPTQRRTRTLGIGSSVRFFNDRAVPGLGGVWFGKQILLSLLGIVVAENARIKGNKVQNIEVTNAIEALACLLSFEKNNWEGDARLLGKMKLKSRSAQQLDFKTARQRTFYVTQPMRMATVQSLPALGFVESDSVRFNTFVCSDIGKEFIEINFKNYRPYKKTVVDYLTAWVCGKDNIKQTPALYKALSPLEDLSADANLFLKERLIQGTANESSDYSMRRKNILSWVTNLEHEATRRSWKERPSVITEDHWLDMNAGAKFFEMRDVAIKVLDMMEEHIGRLHHKHFILNNDSIPNNIENVLEKLHRQAQIFKTLYNNKYLESDEFCNQCLDAPEKVLCSLVKRDGKVLRLDGDTIRPGQSFMGVILENPSTDENEADESNNTERIPLPKSISYRVKNLFLLNLDLKDRLTDWLMDQDKDTNNEA